MDRTPEEWRDVLLPQLALRREDHRVRRTYYSGDHPLPTAPNTSNPIYRRLARLAETNLCGLIVDTINEKLRPTGVRLSENGAADLEVWRDVWQDNNLDADWPIAQEEALKVGRAFVYVWPRDTADPAAGVDVCVEDPDEVIVAYAPGSRRKRVAALKSYVDHDTEFVTVWTLTEVQAWSRKAGSGAQVAPVRTSADGGVLHIPTGSTSVPVVSSWVDDGEHTGPNPYGMLPIVELMCKPSIKGRPSPEISGAVIKLQDRLNKTMFDAVVAGEFGAFPQRYAIGIEVETTAAGEAVNPLTIGPNRAWILEQSEGQSASIGQLEPFPTTDLLNLAEATTKHLASISKTPIYHLLSGLSNIGADTIRAAETGHVAKLMRHQTTFGEAGEDVFRTALRMMGDTEVYPDIELEWARPETRSPAELADAAIKMSQAGYPFPAIARYFGETPTSLQRIMTERAEQGADTVAAPPPRDVAETLQKVYLAVTAGVITAEEARKIANDAGANLDLTAPRGGQPVMG